MSSAAAQAAVEMRVPGQRRRRPAVASPGRPAENLAGSTMAPGPLWAPEHERWASATAGRIALDGYSWLQAVVWVAASGLYEPRRQHGPRFGDTTVEIARLLAELDPCRPGVAYLMRRTGLSRRTVQYHLEMLREAGLLAYVAIGTRVAGEGNQASEYVLVVPPVFDQALGVRTVGEGPRRRPCGIAEAGRKAMGALGRKAAARRRRKRRATSSSSRTRCTPMQGGSSTSSTTGITPHPSEGKLASGKHTSPSPKKTKRGPHKLNTTGRRHQLAGELMRQVPWLRSASRDRISWVISEAADAGWTCDEVLACLDLRQQPPNGVRRASGFLAARLRGMTTMPGWTTRKQRNLQVDHRNAAVDAARKNRIKQERDQQERSESDWQPPTSPKVQRLVNEAFTQVTDRQAHQRKEIAKIHEGDSPLDLEQLTEDDVVDLQAIAQANPALITSLIESAGEHYARRLYSNDLVDQVLRPVRSSLTAPYQVWRNA